MSDEDLHGGDDAATNLTPEERIGLIPTWIVSRDDLNRAERANIAAGLRWARRGRFDVLDPASLFTLHRRMFGDVWRWAGKPREFQSLCPQLFAAIGNIWELFFVPLPLFPAIQSPLRCKAS